MPHSCYILSNTTGKTYNGYTVNFERRLRQHNGEIKGGARYTTGKGPWEYILKIESESFTKNIALSLEWSVRYPTNKKPRPCEYNGPLGRIKSIPLILRNPKFRDYKMRISVSQKYKETLIELCKDFSNVDIIDL